MLQKTNTFLRIAVLVPKHVFANYRKSPNMHSRQLVQAGVVLPPLLLLAVFLLYAPGLKGPFLFDDFANLPSIGTYGGVRDWNTFKLYLTEAPAGPTGRPVAVASFLLNATNWPADAFPFKLTNLLLHLANGALLFALLVRLLRLRYDNSRSTWIAMIAAAWWLLHPMFVSTVLYAVQRMAMLPVTFTLLGFLAYLHGRGLLPRLRGYLWMTGAIGIATLLATFSKENGALFPLLLLITELIWIRPHSEIQPDRRWLAVCLGLPATAIIAYLLLRIPGAASNFANRPFTLEERLLTEGRILCDYLWHLFFPRLYGSGLFHDNYPVSTSVLSPPATLAALLGIAFLLVSAWLLRRRFPLYSLAVFFFFAGHLVESTVISLELYFEHRNYLPALFLFLPPAAAVVYLCRYQQTFALVPLVLFLLLGFITFQRAQTWQDEHQLLSTWAQENPGSVRAQIYGALTLQSQEQHQKAYELLLRALQYNPESLSLNLYAFKYTCDLKLNPLPRLQTIRIILKEQEFDFHHYSMLSSALHKIHENRCQGVPPETVYSLLDLFENNSAFRKHHATARMAAHWRGELLLADGKPEQALTEFFRSQKMLPDLEAGMMQVSLLAGAKHYDKALSLLSMLEQLRQRGLGIEPGLDYEREMERVRTLLLDDLGNT
jgi:protein O-mannosyl-transferase